jgi:membrane protein YdbS with pleckstrin-like domain
MTSCAGCRREETVMLLTVAIFFLIVAIVAGVFALTIKGPLVPILFVVALIMFVWSGIMHLRERRRGHRR